MERARAAQRASGVPVEPVVTILDVHALLGLGQADRAEEVVAREARGRPGASALEVALLVRRGELAAALAGGDAALAGLEGRADLLFRSVLARDLTRAALGLGEMGRASKMLRLVEAGAEEPGLAALRPILDAEAARLAEAEGDLVRARQRIERAFTRIPGSPFVTIDRDALHGRAPRAPASAPPVVRAYAALRGAERALEAGAAREAEELASAAERFYAGAHLDHETARARLARAEALALAARAGDEDAAKRAREALASCEALASARGYLPVVAAASLVRAALAEQSGDVEGASSAIEAAVRAAGETLDGALAGAAARLGVEAPPARGGRGVHAARIARLGLDQRAEVLWTVGSRSWLRAEGDPPPEPAACIVDVDARRVAGPDGLTVDLPEQRVALLSALAQAGASGATLEELFVRVWRASFHPLRHRNAVYVALTRLKDSLRPLGAAVRIAHEGERYRLDGPLPVAVRRRCSGGLDLSGGSDPSR